MVGGRDDAFLLHPLDQRGGLVVADGEAALDVGGRGLLVVEDDRHRLVVELVARATALVAERRGLSRAEVLPLADGRILTGNQGIAAKLIDEVGGESEAIDWLEKNKSIKADLPITSVYPIERADFSNIGKWLGGEARAAIGLPAEGPIALDGLVSLWQVAG
eukprot:gene15437-biopygen13681